MSGKCYDGDPAGGTGDYRAMASYGLNVVQFLKDHQDWVISPGFEGVGYSAQRPDDAGRGAGPRVEALTLDELATLLEQVWY